MVIKNHLLSDAPLETPSGLHAGNKLDINNQRHAKLLYYRSGQCLHNTEILQSASTK